MTLIHRSRHRMLAVAALVIVGVFLVFVFGGAAAFAQGDSLQTVGESAGFFSGNPATIIGRLIGIFLSLLGIIFLILVLYAGFLWMTAAGNDAKVEKAKQTLVRAVIGLVIILASYGIASFVMQAITGHGLWNGSGGQGSGSGGVSVEPFSGSLGRSIRDHYPARGATNIPRNTKIFVTFRDQMDPASFAQGYGTNGTPTDTSDDTIATGLNASNIKIYQTSQGEGESFETSEVAVHFSEDLRTVVFTPPILGSATTNTQYTVRISDNVRNAAGDRVISGGGYRWFFTVGTQLDNDPPSVRSVVPRAGGEYERNVVVEITFDEAVDPTSATGLQDSGAGKSFNNIRVEAAGSGRVDGEFISSNEYRTITFVPLDNCGVNACGEAFYCLPRDADLTVTIKAATPGANPPQTDIFPYDGVVDLVGNAFDGDGNGTAGDDYIWSFSTSDDVRLGAPKIESISPEVLAEDVPLDQNIVIAFNTLMMGSTLHTDNLTLRSNPEHELWYRISRDDIDDGAKTQLTIRHGVFLESTDAQSYEYGMNVLGNVRDSYQNCFFPADGPGAASQLCGTTSAQPYCCNGVASATACSLF